MRRAETGTPVLAFDRYAKLLADPRPFAHIEGTGSTTNSAHGSITFFRRKRDLKISTSGKDTPMMNATGLGLLTLFDVGKLF
jgi:hypothetical protein